MHMANEKIKILGPFWIYQLNSGVIYLKNWAKWAELAVVFRW